MKKSLLLCLICISFSSVFAQSWISSTRLTSTNQIFEISSTIDNNGNVFSFGIFNDTIKAPDGTFLKTFGGNDYFIVKFSQDGGVEWMRQLGSIFSDFVTGGIGSDSEGNIYVTGAFMGFLRYSPTDSISSSGFFDIFLAKYSNTGDVLWVRNAGKGAGFLYSTMLGIDESGDILLSGSFTDSINVYDIATLKSDNSSADYYFAKFLSSNGDLDWIKHVKSLNTGSGNIFNVASTSTNNYFTGLFADSIGFESDTIVSETDKFDVHLIKTGTSGNLDWVRRISGSQREYSYSLVTDDDDNIYIAGYFESDTLILDLSDSERIEAIGNKGSMDVFIAKYLADGSLDWNITTGGKGEDKILDIEFFNDKIYVSGYFADTMNWGGIMLISDGIADRDMFTGSVDKDGNFREANSYAGRNNSKDEARGIFQNGNRLFTVMRTNADLLVLGDSIYTSDGSTFYMVLGVIGCLPISVDNVIVSDVVTCYGDSTGALQILATGGFGSPWQYSIDNGLTYQADITYFGDLPAGEYPVVVIDKENCAQPGNIEVVGQPDSLVIELITSSDITNEADGSIVVAASGGLSPYTYTLQPNGTIQGFGTYTFTIGEEGTYVVEVNDAQNCGPVAIDTIEIISTVGIESISNLQIKVYPNPSSGMMTLEMPFEAMEATLEILSLTGQVVVSRQVYSSGGVIRETIDVSDLSKGMYMLRIDGQTLRSGIVVN